MSDAFPYRDFPSGWFQIGWSDELALGEVRSLRYFGTDLVLYRGLEGTAHVLDAFCGHLGAHLGIGGCVEGDQIVCPFHGWKWDGAGTNTDIPYSTRKDQKRKIKSWTVSEHSGLIWIWHDAQGRAPSWSVPVVPEVGDPAYFPIWPHGVKHWPDLRMHAQYVSENAADAAHFKWVHRSADVATVAEYAADGPNFFSSFSLVFGGDKERTWLTPNGPQLGIIDSHLWGVGVIIVRFRGTDDSVHIQCQTPVDHGRTDLRTTVVAQRQAGETDAQPDEPARARFAQQFKQVERDIVVWENLRYVEHAPFTPEESKIYPALRSWAKQFYAGT